MSFETLKKNRKSSIEKLVQAAEKVGGNTSKSYGDDRLWKPIVDKTGNGYAIIRFLPGPEGNDLPWVRYWDHGFKGSTGRWYIEKSLTSIGKDDPVSEINSRLWNSGNESDKDIARERKRRLHYVSNILVISDPANPENEGKVFLYQYGKKIFDKIMDVMQPEFQDEDPINPFDFWAGSNFKLKIRNFEGYRNYDKSEFESSSELFDGDEDRLKDIYDSLHDLSEFTDPASYKTYAELKQKLVEVLGEDEVYGQGVKELITEPANPTMERVQESSAIEEENAPNISSEDDEESLSYFAKLASS